MFTNVAEVNLAAIKKEIEVISLEDGEISERVPGSRMMQEGVNPISR